MVIEIQHKQAAQGRFFIHHSLYKEPILLFFFFFYIHSYVSLAVYEIYTTIL